MDVARPPSIFPTFHVGDPNRGSLWRACSSWSCRIRRSRAAAASIALRPSAGRPECAGTPVISTSRYASPRHAITVCRSVGSATTQPRNARPSPRAVR